MSHVGDQPRNVPESAAPVQPVGVEADPGMLVTPDGSVMKGNLAWSLAGQFSVRGLTFVIGIVLARIFTPEQFGEYAVALTALAILLSLNDLGISATLTRWQGDIRKVSPTAVTLTLTMSTMLTLLAWQLAGTYARLLHAPNATQAVRIMTLLVLVDGVAGPANAFLTRDFRQRVRVVAQVVGTLVGLPVIFLLAHTYGAVAISTGQLVGGATSTIICLLSARYRPRPGWDPQVARRLLRASGPVAGAALLATAVLNTDYVVVGSQLGPTQLGIYVIAWQISNWPSNLISAAIQPIAAPALASLGNEPVRRGQLFSRAFELLGIGTAFVVAPIAIAAPAIVETLYGHRWLPASAPLTLLIAFSFCRVTAAFLSDALLAAGQGARLLTQQLVWLACLVPAVVVGAHIAGITGVAAAQLAVCGAVLLPLSVNLSAQATALSRRDLAAILARILGRAAPVAAVGIALRLLLGLSNMQLFLTSAAALLTLTMIFWARLGRLVPTKSLAQLARRQP